MKSPWRSVKHSHVGNDIVYEFQLRIYDFSLSTRVPVCQLRRDAYVVPARLCFLLENPAVFPVMQYGIKHGRVS
jgi:hypothetical protein